MERLVESGRRGLSFRNSIGQRGLSNRLSLGLYGRSNESNTPNVVFSSYFELEQSGTKVLEGVEVPKVESDLKCLKLEVPEVDMN